MSYILDALKRSEQERHQDKMPSFSAESMIIQTSQKKTHWWPYALIIVLILNALVLFFFYRESTEVVEGNLRAQEISSSDHSDIKQTDRLKDVPEQNQMRAPPSSVMKERQYIQPIKQVSVSSNVNDWPTASIDNRVDDHLYGTTVEEGLLIKPKSKPNTQTQKRAQKITSQAKEQRQFEPIIQINPTQTQDNVVSLNHVEDAMKNTINSTDNFADVPLLSSMDSSFQKTIPALAFNSHIYSDKHDQRRVMINNFYLKEGQSFDGLDLIEIGELFIIVSKNNTVFKLPVLRDWAKM